jgi:hypothetical protein
MKSTQRLIKILGFAAWVFFVPLCNFLYRAFFSIPEIWREYIFYLRVPLLAVFLLLAFPIISIHFIPFILRNIFVMSKWKQVSLGIFSALLAGRAVIIVINAILENAPIRFGSHIVFTMIFPWDYIFSIGLGSSVVWGIISQTNNERHWWDDKLKEKIKYDQEIVSKNDLYLGIVVGLIAGIIIFVVDKLFLLLLETCNQTISMIILAPWQWFGDLDLKTSGYFYLKDNHWLLASGHLAGLSFFAIGLALFIFAGCYFRPDRQPNPKQIEAPVLIYLATFLAVGVPILATMTFALDKYKFPTIVTALSFIALSYWIWQVDYYFELSSDESNNNPRDFETAISQRLQFQDETHPDRTLVVVTTSGGGIHAAGWTTQVLTGLQELLGQNFTKSIGLISSVSGGSVGTMYFLAYCEKDGCIKSDNLSEVVEKSVQDGLDAIGWGLVYQDFAGLIGIPWLTRSFSKIKDRGTALEQNWQEKDLDKTTLEDWRKQIFTGQIPISVFNTTLVEDGRRLLFSPMTFARDDNDLTIDSNTLYQTPDKKYTLKAATAARLSATFPYVSPSARNKDIVGIKRNYHIVDGGYFDNSGVVTAIEWLDDNIDTLINRVNVKKLIFIEIEAFEAKAPPDRVKGTGGWGMAIFGPLQALFNVRDSSLITRNQQEISLLVERYRSELDCGESLMDSKVQYLKIEFPSTKYSQPLSWKLTASQKYALDEAWQGICNSHPGLLNLERLWRKKWNISSKSE